MFTYNGTAVLQFDSPVTGNAGSGVTVTVRGASTPVAGLGGLANIYNFNESAIPNPLTTDSKGNYTFKALNGTYDIILSEGDPTEVILPSQQFVDLTEVSIGVAQEVQTLTDGQTVVTFTSQTTTSAEFHINGQGVDSRLLTSQDINGALTTTTTITLFDSYPGGSIVTLSKNTDAGNTVAGIVIPTVEEEVVLTDGQLVVTFSTLTTEYSEFHINGIGVDSRLLTSDDINHSLTTPSTITLFESYPVGSIVTLAQNSTKGNISVDITNNIIKDLSQAYIFDTVADFKASTIVFPDGKTIEWLGYYAKSDGGGNWGIVKSGAHTDDGGSVFSLANGNYVEANLQQGKINVRKFGAKGDYVTSTSTFVTDDTLAIQSAITYLESIGDGGGIYVPKGPNQGFYGATNIQLSAGIQLFGDGAGITYIIQKLGETTPLVEAGDGRNVFIKDIALDFNYNTIPLAGLYLGYGSNQFGVVAGITNVFCRNVVGDLVAINGNTALIDWLEVYDATGTALLIDGDSNKCSNIMVSNADTIGVHLKGSNNSLISSSFEAACATACVLIGDNTIGVVVSDFKVTGVAGNIHGAGVKIGTSASNFNVSSVRGSVTTAANIANGLIYDTSSGTRKIWGLNTGGVSYAVPNYDGGTRVQLPYKDSIPPTVGTHKAGDWFVAGIGIPGFPTGWIASNSADAATTGTFTPMDAVAGAIELATGTVLTSSAIGKRFMNEAAANTTPVTLPAIKVGDRIHFTRRNNTHAFIIDPNGSQLIRPGASGKYISLDTDGASVTLEYMSPNSWVIVAQSGTVTHEP